MSEAKAADRSIAAPRILIVDDEPGMIEILEINLAHEGYDVKGVLNGPEALLQARADPPALIILDVMMPGMNGWQVLEQLQADPRTAEIPVVMLTVMAQNEDVVKGLEKGAVEYITKPFHIRAVTETIKLVLTKDSWRNRDQHRQRRMAEQRRMMKPLHDLFPDKEES